MWTLPSFTPGSLFWSMLTLHSAMLSRIISKNKKKKRKNPLTVNYTSAFLPKVNGSLIDRLYS